VKTRFHRARALLRQSLQDEAANLLPDLYAFDGARCERIVAAVLRQLSLG
jgi:RNA polymerase sigma-70 factor, ECF subfamily